MNQTRPPRWAIKQGYEWSEEAGKILLAPLARSLRSKANAQIRRLRKIAEAAAAGGATKEP